MPTTSVHSIPSRLPISQSINEGEKALNFYLNNSFDEAEKIILPLKLKSIYHALGYSCLKFIQAIFTFEKADLESASANIDEAVELCSKTRRQFNFFQDFGHLFVKPNYEQYTESEVHAELVMAELLFLRSTVKLFEDETLGSFIKSGMNLKNSYNTYKDCKDLLKISSWNKWTTKAHFESGVKTGLGTFQLMVSLMPTKVKKLLEFIGFSGNRKEGIQLLEEGARINGCRQSLCKMLLLFYFLFLQVIVIHSLDDLSKPEEVIDSLLVKFPKGVWFLFLKGRCEFLKGNFHDAIDWYTKAWKSQNRFPQIHCFCFWEMLWVHSLNLEWDTAYDYADRLIKGSKWSPCIYRYQKAVILLHKPDKEKYKKEINTLLTEVPKYYQRIAGKHIPTEKYVVTRTATYFEQQEFLVTPMFEIMFMWNFFKILRNNHAAAANILTEIEMNLSHYDIPMAITQFDYDNKAMLLLLHGACLRQMEEYSRSLDQLKAAIALEKMIKRDTYIIPYCTVELAYLYWDMNNKIDAILTLEAAKKNFSGYFMESKLNIKIDSAMNEFKSQSAYVL